MRRILVLSLVVLACAGLAGYRQMRVDRLHAAAGEVKSQPVAAHRPLPVIMPGGVKRNLSAILAITARIGSGLL